MGASSTVLRLSLLAAAALGGVAAAKVIGEDGRRPPGAGDADLLSSLGLIVCAAVVDDRRRRSAGTGTVVGSRSTVLTSAHVLIDDAGRRGPRVRFDPPADCVFRQYDALGEVRVEVGFSRAEMGEFWRNPGVPNQDWAVLETESPLPAATAAVPFAIASTGIDELDGMPIRMLAFHADRRSARRLPMLSEGRLFGTRYGGFRRLAHTADTERMSSGAALVRRTGGGHHVVVGVNRSSANFGDFNLAVPLSPELITALRSQAFGQVPLRGQRLASNGR